MKKIILVLFLCILSACSTKQNNTIQFAAASSLENTFEKEIIPLFNKEHNIKVSSIYDGSGKLKQQILSGLNVDFFISASEKEINELKVNENYRNSNSFTLLRNKLVLITNKNNKITKVANAKYIAIGDPSSVPAGYYAKQYLEKTKEYSKVKDKLNYATNVSQVVDWVATNNVDVGFAYKSDVVSNKNIKIIKEIKSINTIEYPLIQFSDNTNAVDFINFLQTDKVKQIFKKAGFIIVD